MGTCCDPWGCGDRNRSAQSQRTFRVPDLTLSPAEDGGFIQEGLKEQGSPAEQDGETHFLCKKRPRKVNHS